MSEISGITPHLPSTAWMLAYAMSSMLSAPATMPATKQDTFSDPNLVSRAGLAPVLELAARAGLEDLVAERVRIGRPGGGNAV